MRRTRRTRWMRAAPVVAVVCGVMAAAGACGGGSDAEPGPSDTPSKSPESKGPKQVRRANKVMAATSFTSSGPSTAFESAEQRIWWDPELGLRMKVELEGGEQGEIRCEDGTTYTSATLLAASLRQKGAQVTVPDELSDTFVVIPASGQECDAYFSVPTTAERSSGKDTMIDGGTTRAFTAESGQTADVYYIASDKGRLLRMESRRDGRTSTTRYSGFGEEYEIDMPPAEQTMKMSEFQKRVG